MKSTLVCLICLLGSLVLRAQKHEIYITDSLYLNPGTHDFKDVLPDGNWIMYEVIKKKKYIIATGTYKNSLKEGSFKNYGIGENGFPITTYNYKQGKLHGPYEIRYDKYRLMEQGTYIDGKRQGYFIRWSVPGLYYIRWIENYHNDTLYDCVGYYENSPYMVTKAKRQGFNDTSEIIHYDTNTSVLQRIYIVQNKIIKVVNFYPNGEIESEIIGDFFGYHDGRHLKYNPEIDYYSQYSFWGGPILFPPFNGKRTNYHTNGSIGSVDIYKEGKLIKKENNF